jgi:MFS family permease
LSVGFVEYIEFAVRNGEEGAVKLQNAGVLALGAGERDVLGMVLRQGGMLAAIGIGLANTGSLGLLIEAVPVERIVTAMVIWSQIGILGYLLGPLAGGLVADGAGYAFIGLVPAAAGMVILALLRADGRASRPSARA